MEDASRFEQEHQEPLLPYDISVSVTYAYYAEDYGDGETGPRPVFGNRPVFVDVRNSSMGETIVALMFHGDGPDAWRNADPAGGDPQDVIRAYFGEDGEEDRRAVMGYLMENGLI